jgi:hypothetical protein
LYCIVLYCIVLYCIVLYCIVLYCIVLYCIVLSVRCSDRPFSHAPPTITVHRPSQSIPYFQNVVTLHGANVNIFPFTPTTKARPSHSPIFTKLVSPSKQHVQSYIELVNRCVQRWQNIQLRDKILHGFSCTNFRVTQRHWIYIYIYIYIMCVCVCVFCIVARSAQMCGVHGFVCVSRSVVLTINPVRSYN